MRSDTLIQRRFHRWSKQLSDVVEVDLGFRRRFLSASRGGRTLRACRSSSSMAHLANRGHCRIGDDVVIGNDGQAQPVSPRVAESPRATSTESARFDAFIATAGPDRRVANGILKGLRQIGRRPGQLRVNRLRRSRNAATHGGPLSEAACGTIAELATMLALQALNTTIWATVTGQQVDAYATSQRDDYHRRTLRLTQGGDLTNLFALVL
jgi:hypothetical protein